MSRVLLVDISGIAYAIWHVSGKEPDQDYVSKSTVAKVYELARGFDHVAICCDGPKNFRKDISPEYKANRESNEVVKHQLRMAQDQLADDGFAVWKVEGSEADDLVASAVKMATANADVDEVMIASADKDLLALVDEDEGFSVRVHSPASGKVYGHAEVRAKFGVFPRQMRDLLCLMGDKSDNVAGVPGIGQVRGAELLNAHGTLAEIYAKLGDSCTVLGLKPSTFSALKDNAVAVEMARKLVTLRDDVPLPFDDIFKPRTPKAAPVEFEQEESMETTEDGEVIEEKTAEPEKQEPKPAQVIDIKPKTSPEKLQETSTALAPVEWSKGLEPTGLSQAMNLAKAIHQARRFSAYNSPEDVLLAIMTGRELNIGTMAALRSIHIVDGKPTMSADLMAALVLRSGKAKQFEVIERTNEKATIRCWRVGEEKPIDVSYTVEDAKRAGRVKPGSGWEKNPADMCVARCKAIGARLKWPDVIANMYDPDELERGAA